MNNQHDLFYNTSSLSPILFHGDLGDEVPVFVGILNFNMAFCGKCCEIG